MKYSDLDIQQLIPLSEMVLDKDVVRILRDTLHGNTLSSRPTALDLLECPALKNGEPGFGASVFSGHQTLPAICGFIVTLGAHAQRGLQ